MVIDVKTAKRSRQAMPSDAGQPELDDGPAVDPPVARAVVYSTGEPLASLAPRWPHIEAALVRKRALSRRRR